MSAWTPEDIEEWREWYQQHYHQLHTDPGSYRSVDSAASLLSQHASHPNDSHAIDFASSGIEEPDPDVTMQLDPALNPNYSNNLSAPPPPPPNKRKAPAPSRESSDNDVNFNDLQNPSDALDILAHIASNDGNQQQEDWTQRRPQPIHRPSMVSNRGDFQIDSDLDYILVHTGALTSAKVWSMVDRYYQCYHPYFPIVPPESFDRKNLPNLAKNERHLLTAMLVIASKDLVEEPHVFAACSEHMQSLVSGLAAGASSGVEAVEALLLLAEWTPYTSKSQPGQVGRGEEDREAWMHVGNALRIGYFLGLDRYSFKFSDFIKDPAAHRKRLCWTACYISDRQISIRIGRGFWSRGPGPMTTLRKEDFPSLAPRSPGAEDYASIFQATLELTMLFSNVHDVLYSNPSGMRTHLTGGYIKFIDDFRSAIYGWNSVYGTLTCKSLQSDLVLNTIPDLTYRLAKPQSHTPNVLRLPPPLHKRLRLPGHNPARPAQDRRRQTFLLTSLLQQRRRSRRRALHLRRSRRRKITPDNDEQLRRRRAVAALHATTLLPVHHLRRRLPVPRAHRRRHVAGRRPQRAPHDPADGEQTRSRVRQRAAPRQPLQLPPQAAVGESRPQGQEGDAQRRDARESLPPRQYVDTDARRGVHGFRRPGQPGHDGADGRFQLDGSGCYW